jgi:hypothetical protein
MNPNQPTSPHVHVSSTTYIVPKNHFNDTTSNISTVSDLLLVGTHTILTIPQVNWIGTPLPSRPNPSIPPGYNALTSSITNPT